MDNPYFHGKIYYKLPFSIAMLVITRGCHELCCPIFKSHATHAMHMHASHGPIKHQMFFSSWPNLKEGCTAWSLFFLANRSHVFPCVGAVMWALPMPGSRVQRSCLSWKKKNWRAVWRASLTMTSRPGSVGKALEKVGRVSLGTEIMWCAKEGVGKLFQCLKPSHWQQIAQPGLFTNNKTRSLI